MQKKGIHKLTFLGLCTALALVLAYLESLLPPIVTAIPGIKMGLPNVVIFFVLYRYGLPEAAAVSFIRLLAVTFAFGTAAFPYSLAGAVLSLLLMALLRKLDFLSTVGVSVAGAIAHNLGQVLMAMWLLRTAEIGYYMIVLALTGTVSGVFIGLLAALALKRIKKY